MSQTYQSPRLTVSYSEQVGDELITMKIEGDCENVPFCQSIGVDIRGMDQWKVTSSIMCARSHLRQYIIDKLGLGMRSE